MDRYNKNFNAILAKNQLARMIKGIKKKQRHISPETAIIALEDIEAVIGQANQPSARDIYESDLNI